MSEIFREWILRLAGAAILPACAMALTPEVKARKAVRAVCACITLLAFIYPLMEMKIGEIDDVFSDYREQVQAVSGEIMDVNEKIQTDIIESETEAYILDKGKNLGLEMVSAEVEAKGREDGNFYPYTVKIEGRGNGGAVQSLKDIVAAELGVAPDKIYWRDS